MKLELNVKEKSVQYLHGIALAVHSVLRAGDRGAVTPVQVELQALVCLRQISSWNAHTAQGDFDWKRREEKLTGRRINVKSEQVKLDLLARCGFTLDKKMTIHFDHFCKRKDK